MSMKRNILVVVLTVVMIASLALFVGCQADNSDLAEDTADTADTTEETEGVESTDVEESADSGEEELTFMMIARGLTDPFYVVVANGAEAACEELGINFILQDANGDQTTQLNIIDTAISMGVDGVAINAVDERGVITGIEALNEAGIPVVAFDVIPTGGQLIGAIGIDNYKICHEDAVIFGQLLEEKYNGEIPEGAVVLNIQGDMSMQIAQERSNGFTDYMEENYPEITIANAQGMFNPTKANEVTADLFTRYGDDIIGMHTITGCMTEGIASAVESAGYDLTDFIFVDNGAFSIDLQLIKEGQA